MLLNQTLFLGILFIVEGGFVFLSKGVHVFVCGICVHVCIEGGREEDQGLLGTGH